MASRYVLAIASASSDMGGWFDYAKIMCILIAICIIALIATKAVLPKLSGFSVPASNTIRVLARHALEPRKTLYVVKAGKTAVLLASSADQVQFMTTLDPGDFEEPAVATQSGDATGSAFRRFAKTITDRK